ncbi:hypothetical protein YSY43_43540 [Paenibacillus sp. YSY-4.3]
MEIADWVYSQIQEDDAVLNISDTSSGVIASKSTTVVNPKQLDNKEHILDDNKEYDVVILSWIGELPGNIVDCVHKLTKLDSKLIVIFSNEQYNDDVDLNIVNFINNLFKEFVMYKINAFSEGIVACFRRTNIETADRTDSNKLKEVVASKNKQILSLLDSEEKALVELRDLYFEFNMLEAKYENIRSKYDLLSNSKLGKLTLKYWKSRGRIPDDF